MDSRHEEEEEAVEEMWEEVEEMEEEEEEEELKEMEVEEVPVPTQMMLASQKRESEILGSWGGRRCSY